MYLTLKGKKKMKRIFSILAIALVFVMCAGLIACTGSDYVEPTGKAYYDYKNSPTSYGEKIFMRTVIQEIDSMKVDDFEPSDQQSDYVLIKVKGYGEIVVLLRHDVAPETVENFKKLTAEKFYDGTIFHRVIEGFMIQGGGMVPNAEKGTDGEKTDYVSKQAGKIDGEFTNNGFKNNLKHVRGVISMARVGAASTASDAQKKAANNSASSQFFIVHKTEASAVNLNGDYATFGYVLAGMDVVDAIAECEVIGKGTDMPMPLNDIVIESVTFVQPK